MTIEPALDDIDAIGAPTRTMGCRRAAEVADE
jgi:hypothetical protein